MASGQLHLPIGARLLQATKTNKDNTINNISYNDYSSNNNPANCAGHARVTCDEVEDDITELFRKRIPHSSTSKDAMSCYNCILQCASCESLDSRLSVLPSLAIGVQLFSTPSDCTASSSCTLSSRLRPTMVVKTTAQDS